MLYGKLAKTSNVWGLTLGQVLSRTASLCPDKVAIKEDDKSCTYQELAARVNALAAGLTSLGVKNRSAFLRPYFRGN